MRNLLICVLALGWAFLTLRASGGPETKENGSQLLVAHNVYFTLKDNSAASRKKLVEACRKYLAHHPGTVFFAVGTRGEDFKREVNDRDFDVSLHIVFKDKLAHDKYQDAPRHHQFIEENRENWKKVRVFDSEVETQADGKKPAD